MGFRILLLDQFNSALIVSMSLFIFSYKGQHITQPTLHLHRLFKSMIDSLKQLQSMFKMVSGLFVDVTVSCFLTRQDKIVQGFILLWAPGIVAGEEFDLLMKPLLV